MNDQRQITPKLTPILGPGKFFLVTLAAIAIVWFVIQSRILSRPHSDLQLREMFPAGCIYGLLATGCWMSTVVSHRYGRLLIRVLLVIAATLLLSVLRESRDWFQTAADFSGITIMQCMLFFWFQVPRWRTSGSIGSNARQGRGDQFGIADIAIVTTVMAILFALAVRYSPSIKPVGYWLVLTATWVGGATVTTCIAAGITSKSIWRALLFLMLALSLAVFGTYGIAIADSIVDEGKVSYETVNRFASYYGRVVWGYLLTFLFFSCFARTVSHHPADL